MALATKLQLRQSQSLVMTPQLMQSIRLLQLTRAELERFIDEEIERNPFLERAEAQEEAPADQARTDTGEGAPELREDWFETGAPASAEAMSDRLDTSLENLFPDDPGTSERLGPDLAAQWKSAPGSASGAAPEGFDMAQAAAAAVTLRDHVGEQVALAFHDPVLRLIAGNLPTISTMPAISRPTWTRSPRASASSGRPWRKRWRCAGLSSRPASLPAI